MEEGNVTPEEDTSISMHTEQARIIMICLKHCAIKKAFGDAAKDVVVNSTKSMIGHLTWCGRCGRVYRCCENLFRMDLSIRPLEPGRCDEECDLNYAVGAPVEKEIKCALTNSLGFGGHNATLLLKKYEG